MSKGRGRVERGIIAALHAARDTAFTTDELCERIYGVVTPQVKHRSSVVRAMQRLAANLPDVVLETRRGRGSVIYSSRSNPARELAWAKLVLPKDQRGRLPPVVKDEVWNIFERSRYECPTLPVHLLRANPEIFAEIDRIQRRHDLSFQDAQILLAAYGAIALASREG